MTAKGGMWEKIIHLRETKLKWITSNIPPLKFSKDTGKMISVYLIGIEWTLDLGSVKEIRPIRV